MKNRRGLKRALKRIKDELMATKEISKVLDLKSGLISLRGKVDIQIMVHNGRKEYNWIKKDLIKKHEVMNLFFNKVFSDFRPNVKVDENARNDNGKIWICWWQGTEKMPEIVRECVKSIKQHSGSHEVIIITEENCNSYVEFPDFIKKKYEEGIISKTHLSDLLRFELLSKYGGMWLDATFFCTDSLDKYFEEDVWSIKRPDYRHTSVSCGLFATYSLECNYKNRYVFETIKQYIYQYWKKYDYLLDYLFLDYLIMHVISNDELIRSKFDNIKSNNPMCDELLKVINNKFDKNIWRNLNEKTDLFKLSWKCPLKKQENSCDTFFKELLDGKLY